MSLPKSCFALGTGENLACTTVSSFVWKRLRNMQTDKQTKKRKGSRTAQIRKLRDLESIMLYTQLKGLGVPRLQKVLKKDIMMFHYTKKRVIFYFYWERINHYMDKESIHYKG